MTYPLARIFPAICLGVLVLGASAQAQAPAADLDTLSADVLSAISPPAPDLSLCLAPLGPEAPPHDAVTFTITLDADGLPTGPAELLDPAADAGSMEHFRQFLRAEAAMTACQPAMPQGAQTLTIAAGLDALTILDAVPAMPATPDDPESADTGMSPILGAPGATDADADADAGADATVAGVPDAQTEAALGLRRADRREVQVRLDLAGFASGAADGVFGPRTRAAISEWQGSADLPVTGYLDAPQLARLTEDTSQAYADWLAAQPQRRNTGFYVGSDGCLRSSAGKIVPNRSFKCDALGLLGR